MQAYKQPDGDKRQRVDSKVIQLQQQKAPPAIDALSDERAEAAVCGAVLHNPALYPTLAEMLQPADFYFLWYGFVWWAFEELDRLNKSIDAVTVQMMLETKGVGDPMRLATLTGAVPEVDHAETYAKIVYDHAMLRRIYVAAAEMQTLATADGAITNVEAIVDQCNTILYRATDQRTILDSHVLSTVDAYMTEIENRMLDNKVPGVRTGFIQLDESLKGLQSGELIVVGGYAGMGKTTWMLAMILNMLRMNLGVSLYSLEMTKREIVQALAAMLSGVPKGILKGSVLNRDQFSRFVEAMGIIAKFPLYITDKEKYPELTPLQHKRSTRVLQRQARIDVSFIDGLWLMEPTPNPMNKNEEKSRPRDVHHITRDLIKNAGTLKLPIILMHQYKDEYAVRMSSTRRTPSRNRPVLRDFAESIAVQRNAPVIIGLHRPAQFNDTLLGKDLMYAYIFKDRNNGYISSETYIKYHYDAQHSLYVEV
jgi:replicative DNA helicase